MPTEINCHPRRSAPVGLCSSSVADFSAGHEFGGEVVVVGASVVMSGQRHCVLEVGVAAVAPGVAVMDVAPGVGAFAAFGGARVVGY